MNIKQKISISIIAILFAIVGLFGVFYSTQNDSIVKADESISESYYFQSSQLIFPMTPFVNTNQNTSSVSNYIYDNFVHFTFGLGSDYSITSRGDYGYLQIIGSRANGIAINSNQGLSITYQFQLTRGSWSNFYIPTGQSSRWYIISMYLSSDFNYNINHVQITTQNQSLGLSNVSSTQLEYFDSNANSLKVQLPFNNTLSNMNNYRYVYNNYYFSGFDTFTDNDFYQAGLQNGKSIGEQIGYDNGLQDGTNSAQEAARLQGYNEGVAAANTYSFLGMIGAAFDVPINAFKEMFDFNVLGVNLKDFFLGIMSLIVIIFIIRLILGGK